MEVFLIEVGATIEFTHKIIIDDFDHGTIRTIATVLGIDQKLQTVHLGVIQIGHDGTELVSEVTQPTREF